MARGSGAGPGAFLWLTSRRYLGSGIGSKVDADPDLLAQVEQYEQQAQARYRRANETARQQREQSRAELELFGSSTRLGQTQQLQQQQVLLQQQQQRSPTITTSSSNNYNLLQQQQRLRIQVEANASKQLENQLQQSVKPAPVQRCAHCNRDDGQFMVAPPNCGHLMCLDCVGLACNLCGARYSDSTKRVVWHPVKPCEGCHQVEATAEPRLDGRVLCRRCFTRVQTNLAPLAAVPPKNSAITAKGSCATDTSMRIAGSL